MGLSIAKSDFWNNKTPFLKIKKKTPFIKGGNCCIWQRRTTVILQSDLFLRGSSTRYMDSASRAHFLKNFLPLSYGQCLKSARFITIYRWYALSYFFENKPPFMADAIAINLFTSPLPRQWCKKVSRKIWNSLGLSTIFTTTNLLFSIFEKQNSLSYS